MVCSPIRVISAMMKRYSFKKRPKKVAPVYRNVFFVIVRVCVWLRPSLFSLAAVAARFCSMVTWMCIYVSTFISVCVRMNYHHRHQQQEQTYFPLWVSMNTTRQIQKRNHHLRAGTLSSTRTVTVTRADTKVHHLQVLYGGHTYSHMQSQTPATRAQPPFHHIIQEESRLHLFTGTSFTFFFPQHYSTTTAST